MFWDKQDVVADPVVSAWDAIQRGTSKVPGGIDESEVTMIASFLSAGNAQIPPARFVTQLGQQLAELGARPGPAKPVTPGVPGKTRSVSAVMPKRFPDTRETHWGGWTRAVAALLVVALIGGLILTWWPPSLRDNEPDAIPAVADLQASPVTTPPVTTFSAVISPAELGLPELSSWGDLAIAVLEVAPGERYDLNQPWFTTTNGIALLQLQRGSLQADLAGRAMLYRSGASKTPDTLARESIALETGDTIAYSIQEGASFLNPSDQPAVALLGLVGKDDPAVSTNSGALPPGDAIQNWRPIYGSLPSIPATSARFTFEHIELAPGEQFSQELVSNQEILGIAVDTATQRKSKDLGLAGWIGNAPPVGPGDFVPSQLVDTSLMAVDAISLSNPGDEPISIYLIGVEYLESAPSTPVASPTSAVGTPISAQHGKAPSNNAHLVQMPIELFQRFALPSLFS